MRASRNPNGVKTRATRKATLPSHKSQRLTTIKETSLEQSLEEDLGSTKEPKQVVDLEFSNEEGETDDKELSNDI